jgi:AraC-like DNA-binding protein
MLEDLKLGARYDGFLYLVESTRNPPKLKSHHHIELELNLVVQGTITYVVNGRRSTFQPRTLLWLFPEQEHQLVDRSDNAQCYVSVFKPSLINKSCRTEAYEGLKRKKHDREGVLNTLLEPDSFDLIRKTMDSLMQGSLDPNLLNREAGFGVGSTFSFQHGDPDGLNAGLHHLTAAVWAHPAHGESLGRCSTPPPGCASSAQGLERRRLEPGSRPTCRGLRRERILPEPDLPPADRCSVEPLPQFAAVVPLLERYRQEDPKTLAEAVYAAGFGSYAQFYKVFTQVYGCGPRAAARSRSSGGFGA